MSAFHRDACQAEEIEMRTNAGAPFAASTIAADACALLNCSDLNNSVRDSCNVFYDRIVASNVASLSVSIILYGNDRDDIYERTSFSSFCSCSNSSRPAWTWSVIIEHLKTHTNQCL